MTVADAIAAALRDAGVRHWFGVPGGGSSLDLIDAAQRHGLRFVLTATETAAAIAAIAQAEIAGVPGVCLTGLGPGAASVVNGAACALLERAPMILITDAHPASAAGCPHQRIDQRALLAPAVKWSAELSAADAAATISEAIARAMTSPRGPVHLDCPADIAAAPAESPADRSRSTLGSPPSEPCTADGRLDGRRFRRPLLVAGLGARPHAQAIRAFARSHRLPAMVTYKAKGVVPDRDAWFAGVFTNGALEQDIVDDADLLITVGLDRVELLPRPWSPRQAIVEVGGDVPAGLRRVADALAPSDWDFDALQRTMQRQRFQLASTAGAESPSARDALTPDRVVRLASTAFPSARVTVDAGAHMFPATLLWPVEEPGGMLISNGLSTMGFALPAAVGAALIEPSRPVVALTGDGGLLMCAGELATVAREALRVTIVVFDDRSLSLIDVKQRHRRFARDGVGVEGVAWDALARAFGLTAFAAATAPDLEAALAAARSADGPALIDARIDPAPYPEMLRLIRG